MHRTIFNGSTIVSERTCAPLRTACLIVCKWQLCWKHQYVTSSVKRRSGRKRRCQHSKIVECKLLDYNIPIGMSSSLRCLRFILSQISIYSLRRYVPKYIKSVFLSPISHSASSRPHTVSYFTIFLPHRRQLPPAASHVPARDMSPNTSAQAGFLGPFVCPLLAADFV